MNSKGIQIKIKDKYINCLKVNNRALFPVFFVIGIGKTTKKSKNST